MHRLLTALALGAALTAPALAADTPQYNTAPINTVFGQGEINPYGQFFTGTSYLNSINGYDEVFKLPASNVTFEPCTRTYWHSHSGGQILFVVAGEGRHQIRGQKIDILRPGDVIVVPPNVEHWHGGGASTWMSHIALTPNAPDNKPTWLQPVTDEEYNGETRPHD